MGRCRSGSPVTRPQNDGDAVCVTSRLSVTVQHHGYPSRPMKHKRQPPVRLGQLAEAIAGLEREEREQREAARAAAKAARQAAQPRACQVRSSLPVQRRGHGRQVR